MPVMNGIDFINEIKRKSIHIPIIVITARKDDLGKLNMLRLGVDNYITKPFIEEELLLYMNKAMSLHSKIQEYETKITDKESLSINEEAISFNKEIQIYIKDNLKNKNFGVDDLAELLDLSRSSLFRKTKLILGQTPNEVIKEVRLYTAKEMLEKNPKIKKNELARLVGVYNGAYLYKKLEERFLITIPNKKI